VAEPENSLSGIAELENPLSAGLESERMVPSLVMVIFGASGDLAKRKILPALESLASRHILPHSFCVVGVARSSWSDEDFRKVAIEATDNPCPTWRRLVENFRYVPGDYSDSTTFERLRTVLEEVDRTIGTRGNRLYYLATLPDLFGVVAKALANEGLSKPQNDESFVRVVVEKPYGRDIDSARKLDKEMHSVFSEENIFRIDHYMGKETVQNVLALRFANAIFEPIWNRRYVDHVQVTVAESIGVEHRGGFYETAGALRDIVQNHLMQVLSLVLLEPPSSVDAEGIRNEKVKALSAVLIPTVDEVASQAVRGQYGPGWIEGKEVAGYREEPGVDPESKTETYVAMELRVDNWRWAGVPIYLRTGKRLPKRATEVVMQFQRVPHLPFARSLARNLEPNALVVRVQPDEGVTLRFGAKIPGGEFRLRSVSMDFSYGSSFLEHTPEAYERLLGDAMSGDATLFIRTDEVDRAWQIVDPFLEAWAEDIVPIKPYPAGTWGPKDADLLLQRAGRRWRTP
jgi:glucose-6-phosphate 1-dehydrogenase